jgi:hypothetical protein
MLAMLVTSLTGFSQSVPPIAGDFRSMTLKTVLNGGKIPIASKSSERFFAPPPPPVDNLVQDKNKRREEPLPTPPATSTATPVPHFCVDWGEQYAGRKYLQTENRKPLWLRLSRTPEAKTTIG